MAPGRLTSLRLLLCLAAIGFLWGLPVGAAELREAVFHAGVGAGIPIVGGEVGEAMSAVIGREITPGTPLFVGLDLGLYRFNKDYSLQDLPTFYYHILYPLIPGATPFLGFSLGPNIRLADDSVVRAQALARGGIHWILSDELGLVMEGRLGVLDSKLFVAPQVNVLWAM